MTGSAACTAVGDAGDADRQPRRFETALPALPDRLKQYSVLPLLQAFARPEEAVNGAAFPTDRFTDAVRGEGGRGRDIPHLSAALIRKYLSDMRQLQLL